MHQQIQQHIIPGLAQRLGLNPDDPSTLNPCHVEALWQLCAFEATAAAADGGSDGGDTFAGSSSSNSRNGNASRQAVCELFTAADVALLEWLDDVRLYETQGYGATVNYAIAGLLVTGWCVGSWCVVCWWVVCWCVVWVVCCVLGGWCVVCWWLVCWCVGV